MACARNTASLHLCGLGILMLCLFPDKTHTQAAHHGTSIFRTVGINSEPKATSTMFFAQQMQDSTKLQTPPSLKLKSPYMAAFYSVIPGAVFHGAGHVYAGRIPTAITLFGGELIGAGLVFLGGVGQIEGPNEGGENAMLIGTVLFFGTWLYDLIGSPMAVNKRNKELLFQKAVGLELQAKDRNARLAIVWRF